MTFVLSLVLLFVITLSLYFHFQSNFLLNSLRNTRIPRFQDNRRKLLHHHHNKFNYETAHLGNSSFVPNITVFGAIISSALDPEVAARVEAVGGPVTSSNDVKTIIQLRTDHIRNLSLELPFPVLVWPPIFSGPCPADRNGHKTERSVALAHIQIWMDFIFFDQDVLNELHSGNIKGKGIYSSTTWTSSSAVFSAAENGTLYRDGVEFKEEDILVVFEDDADVAVLDVQVTLSEELAMMNTDFLFLGWCEGRLARPVPLCTHAYAVTRAGARKMLSHFEPCGRALDLQMVQMFKNKWASFRVANPWSYKNRFTDRYPVPGDKTFGIFHQRKVDLGSINGH